MKAATTPHAPVLHAPIPSNNAEGRPKATRTVRRWRQRPNYWKDNKPMYREAHHSGSATTTPVKRAMVSGGALALTLVGGACDGHAPKVTLPSSTPPTAPSSGLASPLPPKDAAIAAYTGFLEAAKRAILAPRDQARPILQDYAMGTFLDFQVRQVAVHQAAHEEPWGKAIVHVTSVDIRKRSATIHDCQDDSNAGLAEQRTHQLIPQSRGTANKNLIATMKVGSDSRWRVTGLKLYRTACHVA
jgi:hypothetical protein